MLTRLIVELVDIYTLAIFVYVLLSWIPVKQGVIETINDFLAKMRPVSESLQEIHPANWRNGGHIAHHRHYCSTIGRASAIYHLLGFKAQRRLSYRQLKGQAHGYYRRGHPQSKLCH